MKVSNRIYPDEAQVRGFLEPHPGGPIAMVNLLKFKANAEYEDGRETDLTGRQAYELYEQGVRELLSATGGSIGFWGDVNRLVLGEVEELWDVVAVAVWPSRDTMFAVMQSTEMQKIAVHRAAGLAGQLNIETTAIAGDWLSKI